MFSVIPELTTATRPVILLPYQVDERVRMGRHLPFDLTRLRQVALLYQHLLATLLIFSED
jgi:hypothetical protein